jgi:hypothetical protein
LVSLTRALAALPLPHMIAVVALAAMALAGFAIHAVCSVMKERGGREG